ncbi:MAG: TIGR04255 family protein [Bacteroidota bacterium]|nr:TIGR04255 family protein [Bacteroidota bacterium]
MNRKYKNPPIVEALCEIQFISEKPWDLTIPGLFYEKVKELFPIREQQLGIGVLFKPTQTGIEHKIEQAPPRMQFFKTDRSALIQVAPDLLVINQLTHYPTWSKFKPTIIENLDIYNKIASPKSVKRIGLRYINKIIFAKESIELSEYFELFPNVPRELPQSQTDFTIRLEIPYLENDRMLITLGKSYPKNNEGVSIILDLYYISFNQESINIENFSNWLEHAHGSIETAFEACLKDKTRISFN